MAIPRRPRGPTVPWTILTRSAQVWISGVALVASNAVLLFLTSDHEVSGPYGLWQLSAKPSYDKLQSRESELKDKSISTVSAELLLMIVCAMALNGFILACACVLSDAKDALNVPKKDVQGNNDKKKSEEAPKEQGKRGGKSAEVTPATESAVAAPQLPLTYDNELTDNVMMGVGGIYVVIMSMSTHILRTSELSVYTLVLGVCIIMFCVVAQHLGDGPKTLRNTCDCVHNVLLYMIMFILVRGVLVHQNMSIAPAIIFGDS